MKFNLSVSEITDRQMWGDMILHYAHFFFESVPCCEKNVPLLVVLFLGLFKTHVRMAQETISALIIWMPDAE
jgi:hypothetical protein